jgi:hypothetical protein
MLTGQGTTNVDHVMTKNDDTVVLEWQWARNGGSDRKRVGSIDDLNRVHVSITLLFLGGGTGVETQGFTLARQVLYSLSHATSPLAHFCKKIKWIWSLEIGLSNIRSLIQGVKSSSFYLHS